MTVPGDDLHADLEGGWCLPPPAPREALHTRSIVCRSFRRDDGMLDVVWTSQVSKLRFLSQLPKVFKGAHVENPEVGQARAAEVRVEADRPFAVYADGDHLTDLPATIRLLPGALRLIAPENPPDPLADA